jgi:hypothetical protein
MTETKRRCPRCGEQGRAVSAITIDNLVRPDRRPSLASPPYMFCKTPDCAVVYFDAEGGTVPAAGVRVVVFQKETSPQRPVCYCFEHTAADVLGATRADGSNAIVDEIRQACRRGLDRCEETNPQGRCCLANVRGLLRVEPTPARCGGCP